MGVYLKLTPTLKFDAFFRRERRRSICGTKNDNFSAQDLRDHLVRTPHPQLLNGTETKTTSYLGPVLEVACHLVANPAEPVHGPKEETTPPLGTVLEVPGYVVANLIKPLGRPAGKITALSRVVL